jgi:hypothetical protein
MRNRKIELPTGELAAPKGVRELTITEERRHYYTVRSGDRYANSLTEDEALWVVACFLTGKDAGYLCTEAQREANRSKQRKLLEAAEAAEAVRTSA